VGVLQVGQCAVLVVVAAPHRDDAFEAARWCIDTLKTTVPIWKRETWAGGVDWGTDAQEIQAAQEVQAVDVQPGDQSDGERRSVPS
jgi:molybdopterin synthase catalytic subunit